MDYALAHFNMIEQQIRPWDVLDMRILNVMAKTPRHLFVPDGYEELAYSEAAIPLDARNHMLEPKIIGRFLQACNPQPNEKALEIGTGSGYQTALLAQLCQQVDSIEFDVALANKAIERLAQQAHHNVHIVTGDAFEATPPTPVYDIIIINAALAHKPEHWLNKLSVGGRCVAIIDQSDRLQKAVCYTRQEHHQWTEEVLFETQITYLQGEQPVAQFHF